MADSDWLHPDNGWNIVGKYSLPSPPQTIWLQWNGEAEPEPDTPVDAENVSWCAQKVFDHDVEYTRVDDLDSAMQRLGQLQKPFSVSAGWNFQQGNVRVRIYLRVPGDPESPEDITADAPTLEEAVQNAILEFNETT